MEDLCIIEGGIFLSFFLGAGSTIETQQSQLGNTDQYGRRVNPEADKLTSEHKLGINSGGNCTPQDLNDLQNEKNKLCNQSRACSPQMPKSELLRRYEVNLACASVRKQINNQCVGGGDKIHMSEESEAYGVSAVCSRYASMK